MNIENLFIEENLVLNTKIASFFILLYEHFEDVVVNTVRDFFSDTRIMDGVMYCDIDDEYIKLLKRKVENGESSDGFVPYSILLSEANKRRDIYMSEVISTSYTEEGVKEGKKIKGSLKWLQQHNAISSEEREYILKIRRRRNEIVHELFKCIDTGFNEEDAKMMVALLNYNRKINNWRFQQYEMPIMGYNLPDGASADDAIGMDDMTLMSIMRILFLDEGDSFKDALNELGINK